MGILWVTAARGAIYAAAMLVNAVASLILVRRLSPWGYALFQTVVKRIGQASTFLIEAYGVWAYRYAALQDPAAGTAAYLAALPIAAGVAATGYAAARDLAAPQSIAAAAAVTGAALVYGAVTGLLLNAARPLRAALAVMARRLIYAALVALLVYAAGLGVMGALASAAAAAAAATLLGAYWLRGLFTAPLSRALRLLREWLRRSPVSLLGAAAAAAAALDVAVAYHASGEKTVAAYFAIGVFYALTVDAIIFAMRSLHAYVLSTREHRSALNALRLGLLAAAPIAGYAATHPDHTLALISPKYLWAEAAVPAAALASLTHLAGATLFNIAAGTVKEDQAAPRKLLRLYTASLAATTTYLAILVATLPHTTGATAVTTWYLATAARWTTLGLLSAHQLPPTARRQAAKTTAAGAAYTLTATLASAPMGPHTEPARSLTAEALHTAPWLLAATIAYTAAILAADPWTRNTAKKTLQQLTNKTRAKTTR